MQDFFVIKKRIFAIKKIENSNLNLDNEIHELDKRLALIIIIQAQEKLLHKFENLSSIIALVE
jgi:hypothetical protein